MKKCLWMLLILLLSVLTVSVSATGEEAVEPHVHVVGTWTKEQTTHSGQCTVCGETVSEAHSYGKWTSIGPNYHQQSCSVCGQAQDQKHNWDSGRITQWPYCTWTGKRVYTCRDCGGQKTETIPMLEHLYDHSCDVSCGRCGAIRRTQHKYEPDWSSDEGSHWYKCTVCGDKGDLDVHYAGNWIVDVQEGEFTDGQRHKECLVCKYVTVTEVIPATGCLHGNEELRGQKEPSCTEPGYTGNWTCPRCQEVVTPGEEIPMLPHNLATKNEKPSTCVEEGYTGDRVCQDCHATIETGEPLEKLPHTPELQNQKASTCEEEGYTGDHICRDCAAVVTEGEPIEKLPHETELKNAAQPDCVSEGYTGDQICKHCGVTVEQGSPIPVKAHRFEAGVCLDCMSKDPNYVKPTQPSVQETPNVTYEGPRMSPWIVGCIAALGVASAGMAVMIGLLLRKKD